jgi:multidrug resistance efflux pump
MYETGITSTEQSERARTAYTTAVAAVTSLEQRIEALRAAVALAASGSEEIAVRRSRLQGDEADRGAAEAQLKRATVRLGYGEIRSPIDGIVNVRAARAGEVIQQGQAILSLIDEQDIWIRVDVEETYVGRLPIGARLPITLADGSTVVGTVFYRAVDGDFATQRDISRSRRDIRAVQVRLRANKAAPRLVVGTTAYVDVPVP